MNKELNNFKGKGISGDLKTDIKTFNAIFSNDAVFRLREIKSGDFNGCVFFMDGMINTLILNESIIKPLILAEGTISENIAEDISERVLFANEIKITSDLGDMLSGLLYGDTVLLIDKCKAALVINTKGWRARGVTEPNDERVLQGPREGFDEALMLNLAMLRRKLPTPDLAVEFLSVGRKTDTKIFICYIDSLVNKNTVDIVKKRIKKIDIDGILDSNYINELINDNKNSWFKTVGSTERPDIVAARLLEGRIAVMVDGTPVVLTIPYLFVENFQSDDDYYLNFWFAAIGRILRYICFALAVFAPAIYIALTIYNPQLVPTSFLLSVSMSRGGIPFSTFVECIMLGITFEILKETGIRMAQGVGHALSIVGGLVVGQAAVEAKIISAPLLIVVALSGIAGLMLPRLSTAIFYYKFILILTTTFFGMFGFFVGATVMFIKIYSLKSFGIDYTAPSTIFSTNSLKDTLIRAPWNFMSFRPSAISENLRRFRMKK